MAATADVPPCAAMPSREGAAPRDRPLRPVGKVRRGSPRHVVVACARQARLQLRYLRAHVKGACWASSARGEAGARPGGQVRTSAAEEASILCHSGPCAAGWGWGARHHQTARLCIDTCDYFARAWCGQCRTAELPARALAHRQACRRQALQVGRGVRGPSGRARPVARSPWRPSQVGSAICCAMGPAGPLGPRARSVATVGPPRSKVSPPAPLEASVFISSRCTGGWGVIGALT